MSEPPHPALDDFVDELDAAEDDDGEEEGGLVIVEERNGQSPVAGCGT